MSDTKLRGLERRAAVDPDAVEALEHARLRAGLVDRFVVMDAAARMPNSCWGTYKRVAVVELDAGFRGTPKMISERARGVKRIVETWERLRVGKTERCAYEVALAGAHELAARLNGGRP